MKSFCLMMAMLMLAPVSLGKVNIAEDLPKTIELMRSKKWVEAQAKLQVVVDQLADAWLFSSRNYGNIIYNKGYCELQIAKASEGEEEKKYFKMASDSMKQCFEMNMRANIVNAKSLLYRARAEQGLGNFAIAIELNKLFLATQPK